MNNRETAFESQTIEQKIDRLDTSLFDAIASETSSRERRSLLGVQRAIASRRAPYTYLEIGSHLGGSIQPHLLDRRCQKIFSIDPRPMSQPDDRVPGHVAYYEGNSSARMLELLGSIAPDRLSIVRCFDMTSAEVDRSEVDIRPAIAFIDGEHTYQAALSDFRFCKTVVSSGGVILFHDSGIVLNAISEACKQLSHERIPHLAFQLEGTVFGIFLDPGVVQADEYLSELHAANGSRVRTQFFRARIKKSMPKFVVRGIQRVMAPFRRRHRA